MILVNFLQETSGTETLLDGPAEVPVPTEFPGRAGGAEGDFSPSSPVDPLSIQVVSNVYVFLTPGK